jgi:hypothetical protein
MGKKRAAGNRVGAAGTPPPEGKRFKPGQSGNPSGRPAGFAEFREKCREHTEDAIRALVLNLADMEGSVRNTAANTILAYGWGKPLQAVEVSGDKAKDPVQVEGRVKHDDSPERLAAILRVMGAAGVLPAGEGTEGAGGRADPAAD